MKFRRDMSRNGIVGTEPTTRIWLNGTFDVLHAGHIHLFQHARNLYSNTYVCVGVDSDERVAQLKGDGRPVNSLHNRIKFLQAIRYIDKVVIFGSDDELRAQIRAYNPHIMVIGDDYRGRTIIGEEYIPRVEYVKRYDGLSSSGTLAKLEMD
jgi:rfaE bifunctional protein nucleotidyltransferase chain/domain